MRSVWWWLIGLLALLSLVMRYNLLFLMSLLLALVGGASALWARYCLSEVTYVRSFGSTHLFYGDETTLDIEITNAKPLPLPWLRAEDEFPDKLEIVNTRMTNSYRPRRRVLTNLLSLRWYERVTRHYRLKATQRGAWQFGPLEIAAEDIFGFTMKNKVIEESQTVLVYPRVVPLTVLGLPARHPFGDYKTPRRVMEDPLRLMGARAYAPGDSQRYIHWKASARQGTLQTKMFEPSASRPVAIFLNVNTFDHIWEGVDHALQELAITTAASLANYSWDNGYSIGLYVNSIAHPGGERIRIRPGRHSDQLIWVFEALAKVVEYGRWPLEAVVQTEATSLAYGTTVIVVTPRVNDALLQAMTDLRRREHGVVLVTVAAERLAEPPPGIMYYHVAGDEVWSEVEALQLA